MMRMEQCTPKEVVQRAIARTAPPRTPIHYCNRDYASSDTAAAAWGPARGFTPDRPGATEWGYVWNTLDGTMGQPATHPLADWRRMAAYAAPAPEAPGRFDALEQALAAAPDKFALFSVGISGFNQATFLRGFDRLLEDLYAAPERAAAVLDLVFKFEHGLIAQAVRYPIDAVAFGDDWGTQHGLMIDPELWRRVFRPRYEAQFAQIHAAGKSVWFHTCGDVWAIIPDLIAAGVDVLELLQPDLFGVERLAEHFGGRVCFCCSVDHQRRAMTGSRDEIFGYARLLHDKLGAFDGGFIAYIEDYACLGMGEQQYQWIREAFHGLDGPCAAEDASC